MADSIELVIGVDTRQLDRATAGLAKASSAVNLVEKNVRDMMKAFKQGFNQDKLLSVFSRLEKSGMAFSGVVKSLTQDQKMAEKSAGDYNNKLLGVDKAFKSAKSSADAFSVAMKKQETNNKLAAKENERLNHKFVEGYTAMDRYSKELNDLALARKRDIITAEQQKTAVAQLNAQMKAGTGVFATAGGAMQQTARKTNQLGVLMQQTGYQVGDFAVQVQSGTNFMVAFGQQATQLVGTFAMLAKSTKMIALFSGLGILVPILSAIGAYFIRTKDSAKMLEDKIKPLNEALKGFEQELKSSEESVVSWAGAMADINASKIVSAWGKVGKEASAAFEAGFLQKAGAFLVSNLWTGFETASEIKARLLAENFAAAFGKAGEIMLEGALDDIIKAIDKKDVQALDDIIIGLSGISNVSPIGAGFLEALINIRNEADGITSDVESAMRSLQDAIKYGESIEDLKLDLNQDELTRLSKLYSEYYGVTLEHATKIIDRAGKLTGEEKKMLAVRQASVHTSLLQQGVFREQLVMQQSLQAQYLSAEQIQSAIDKANEEHFSKVNELRLISLEAQIKGRDMSSDELTIMQGLGDAVNKVILSYKELDGIIAFGGGQGQIAAGGRGTVIEKRSEAIFRRMGGLTGDAPSVISNKPTTMEGPIKALERQIELSKALFGLQGAARREEEIYMQLKFQNQDVDIKAGKEELELLAERVALEEQRTKAEQMNLENIGPLKKYVAEYAKLVKLKDSGLGDEAFAKEVAKLNEELAKSNPLLNSFTDAFADFLGRGARDFKSFAKDILNDFKSMLIQMITTAARNKIMFSMGMGGGALGTAAAAGGGGTGSSIANLGVLGNAVSSFAGSGIASGFSSALGLGGYASQGLFNVVANAQVAVAAGANAMAASIGALAAPLLAVGAVFSFLRTKTKELDSGLRVTVDNMDVLVKSFKTIQKSRFFGLSKKVRTSEEEASSDISDPIVDAVFTIQESVMEAASAFGVASDKFNDFTYDFEVSLKGLTEDQKMEKLNEEFTKLGDTFTEMSELFTSMNDLLAVYQQRLELEKQLLVAQGDVVKLREQELETIHVLNRDLATRLHLLQAEGDTQSALTAFASGISEQQGLIRRAVDALVKPLQDAIDRTRTQAEKSYSIFKTAADKSADSAKNIVDIITSALDSRTIISESAELMRYQTAQKQLASFAGGAEFDEASLRKATEGVSIDSQKFFGSFEGYARDFYRTQINLEDLAAVAEKELSDVEQQIDIAQKAYEVAMGTHQEAVDLNTAIETLAQDLNIYEATKLANEPLIKMVQDEGNLQIELLDSILVETTKQVNTQLGIESSMADLVGNTMSIGEAMGVLGLEAESLAGGVLALEDIERDINGNVTDLGLYVVDFEGAVEKLDTSVFDLTGTVDDLDGDIKTLFDNINLLDGGIDDFGVKVDGLGVSTDNLGIDITSLGATLSSAMSSLGSIVSGLSSAVSGLASSNNNLAAAQQKATSAAKISTLTTSAAGIAAEISSIESSAGTTAAGATPTQESQLAILKQDLLEEQSKDGADRNLGTAHFNTLINNLNKEIATQVVAAELSSEDSARLALLSGNLETMRQEVTNLGETPTFATGGYHSGGMRLVGENGPELEATGPSRIYSAQQTKNMLSGGSGEVVVELRSLRREVSELKAEQRKVGVENVKYNKKSYDLYREWDTVGLPATRTA